MITITFTEEQRRTIFSFVSIELEDVSKVLNDNEEMSGALWYAMLSDDVMELTLILNLIAASDSMTVDFEGGLFYTVLCLMGHNYEVFSDALEGAKDDPEAAEEREGYIEMREELLPIIELMEQALGTHEESLAA